MFYKRDRKIGEDGWFYKIVYEHIVKRGKVGSILGTKPHFMRFNLDIKGGARVSDILCNSLTPLQYENKKKDVYFNM